MTTMTNHRRKGFTLVESLVAIAIFSILIAVAIGGFTIALRSQREVQGLLAAQSNVDLAIEQTAREVRTGYLFCHNVGNQAPTSSCSCGPVTASNYLDLGAPGALPGGLLPVWTCGTLDFYNAQGQHVAYKLMNGALEKGVGGNFQAITGDQVSVKYLKFTLFGNTEGDNWTPRISIAIGVAPSSSDPAISSDVLNLGTTISARVVDCVVVGASTAC